MTILTGLMTGMFLAALDQTIVSTAIRTICDQLNGLSPQAWVTGGSLGAAVFLALLFSGAASKISDDYARVSRTQVFVAAAHRHADQALALRRLMSDGRTFLNNTSFVNTWDPHVDAFLHGPFLWRPSHRLPRRRLRCRHGVRAVVVPRGEITAHSLRIAGPRVR